MTDPVVPSKGQLFQQALTHYSTYWKIGGSAVATWYFALSETTRTEILSHLPLPAWCLPLISTAIFMYLKSVIQGSGSVTEKRPDDTGG